MIGHCPQNSTALPLRKPLGSNNERSVLFAESITRRFWRKVRRAETAACWEWQASLTGSKVPYGQFTLPRTADQKQPHIYAHRMAWMLTHGPIPDGLLVCHRCDNPKCCNPTHLFLGTQFDNMQDASRKGRFPKFRRGFKLSIADRAVICAQLAQGQRGDQARLARVYGVSRTLISRLARQGQFQAPSTLAQQADRGSEIPTQPFQLSGA